MTEDVIRKLPEALSRHICTLRKASTDSSNDAQMCGSPLKVVNFDKIPKEYSCGKNRPFMPRSNDALYIGKDDVWHFIEFKNGKIDKSEIYRKIYDSIIMLIEMGLVPDFEFLRSHAEYILVYNSDKYPVIQESESRSENFSYLFNLAKEEERLFDIEKFEHYLFHKTHTYTKERFQTCFVTPMEKQEGLTTDMGKEESI